MDQAYLHTLDREAFTVKLLQIVGYNCRTGSRMHVMQEMLPGTVRLRLSPFVKHVRVKSGNTDKMERKDLRV